MRVVVVGAGVVGAATALALAKQALNRGRTLADPFAAFELQQELAALARSAGDSQAAVERFLQKQRRPRP